MILARFQRISNRLHVSTNSRRCSCAIVLSYLLRDRARLYAVAVLAVEVFRLRRGTCDYRSGR